MLGRAVAALGGTERPGQIAMAGAVAEALGSGDHLVVQAGTGTGKSLAYLVPALLHPRRVVVATATLALQHQLVDRDLPALTSAVADLLPRTPSYAVLKGRANYACLHRVREGVPDEQGVLVDVPDGAQHPSLGPSLGQSVLRLRAWSEDQADSGGTGERDNAPQHTDRAWRQVSVNHRECLGAAKCPFGTECFAEEARERAHEAQLVITNHSLLAIDAIQGVPMIPAYDAVVIDEAHELAARVTQAATDEITAAEVERAARRSQRWTDGEQASDLADAADALSVALGQTDPGRLDRLPEQLAVALRTVRDAARACLSAYPRESSADGVADDSDAGRTQAKGMVQEVFTTAERMIAGRDSDVLWLAEGRDRIPTRLCVAPLAVAAAIRERLLSAKTVVFTSATLRLGGDFVAVATSLGLRPDEERPSELPSGLAARQGGTAEQGPPAQQRGTTDPPAATQPEMGLQDAEPAGEEPASERAGVQAWRGVDVGSPFNYAS
ncbi:MAG: ATP-dependent DNA helicase, partial [Nocardioides sp.]